jgi:hypothetical protein
MDRFLQKYNGLFNKTPPEKRKFFGRVLEDKEQFSRET